tara:strand:- start:173 stop:442 length:270 start_codon:yes stop_codon:yes gene_type:complete
LHVESPQLAQGSERVHVAPFAQVAGAMSLKLSSPSAKMRAVLVVESVCAPPEHADVHSSGAYAPASQYSTAPAHPSFEGLLICTLAGEA